MLTVARRGDRVGRLGGDEFALIQRVTDQIDADLFARRMVQVMSEPYELSAGRIEISASIGLATRAGRVEDFESMLQEADLALREAKKQGRATVCLFDPAMAGRRACGGS